MPSDGPVAAGADPSASRAIAIARRVMIGLLPCIAVSSGVDGYIEAGGSQPPAWWHYCSTVFLTLLIFTWYHFDSRARGYRRSKLLNIAILAVAIAGVPWYVYRSRSAGAERKRAMLRLLAYFVVAGLSALGGEWVGGLMVTGWEDAE